MIDAAGTVKGSEVLLRAISTTLLMNLCTGSGYRCYFVAARTYLVRAGAVFGSGPEVASLSTTSALKLSFFVYVYVCDPTIALCAWPFVSVIVDSVHTHKFSSLTCE